MINLLHDLNKVKEINRFVNHGNIGRGFSFTKRGSGRKHNNTSADKRFIGIPDIRNELYLRYKYGRISNSFMKRFNKNSRSVTGAIQSIMRNIYGKLTKILRNK